MNMKYLQNIMSSFLIVAFGFSSYLFAEGSIMVYNYSFYKARVVILTQTEAQAQAGTYSYPAALFNPAPVDENGALKMHPVNANYVKGSNIPLGAVGKVEFDDPSKYFYIQILDDAGTKLAQILLPTQGDNDPDRVVYIYSHMDADGKYVPNKGGSIYLWDAQHSLHNPSIQTFHATAAENGV